MISLMPTGRDILPAWLRLTEVQEAETAQADRRLQLSLALQQQELLRQSLNRLLGSPLPGDFNPMSLQLSAPQRPNDTAGISEAELDSVVARRLDAQMVKIGLKMTGVQKSLYVNQLRPQLDLSLRAGVNGLSGTASWHCPRFRLFRELVRFINQYDLSRWRSVGRRPDIFAAAGEQGGKSPTAPGGSRRVASSAPRWRISRLQIEDELNQQQINLARSYEQLQLARDFEAIAREIAVSGGTQT